MVRPVLMLVVLTAMTAIARVPDVTEPGEGARPPGLRFDRTDTKPRCAHITIAGAVREGDRYDFSLWVRGAASLPDENAPALPLVLRPKAEGKRALRFVVAPGPWRRLVFRWRAEAMVAAGGGELAFCVEAPWTSLSIAGASVSPASGSAPTLAESSSGAAWREAAVRRIEKLRKGAVHLELRDRRGRPRAATVRLRLVRPAFPIGVAVDGPLFVADGTRGEAYRKQVTAQFTSVTLENALKWIPWDTRRDEALAAARTARRLGLRHRGHTLFWADRSRVPKSVAALDKQAFVAALEAHVRDEVSSLRGLVDVWDVVNEPAFSRELFDTYGETLIADAYRWARGADGAVELALNEAFRPGELDEKRFARLTALKKHFTKVGPQSLGVQSHYAWLAPPVAAIERDLDRLAATGLPLDVTEFDFTCEDEEAKARFVRDFLLAAFSHPAVRSLTLWSFRRDLAWRPEAALFEADGTPLPAGKAFLDAPLPRAGLEVTGRADADGRIALRLFHGDWELIVGNEKKARPLVVAGEGPGPIVLEEPTP